MDVEQRARELLAAELRGKGRLTLANDVVSGDEDDSAAIRAIIAALTPPEGYVVVPVEMTDEMVKAVYPLHYFTYLGPELRENWRRMLAARPEVNP
ncbi:hypothetical protein CEE55_01600 [Stenotrophomonas pavanii]|uniref:Uncharacterized protein n=1 Tax=Stenotrophomonas pavanii TaxID=487698 RepID=A0A246L3D8_9GAMM|nr:hypothetical protein [Stenotrophomonas pavanii]OWR35518.1 hypothetical protein CEE55_01600 [Stenotrophomonas pavanii]